MIKHHTLASSLWLLAFISFMNAFGNRCLAASTGDGQILKQKIVSAWDSTLKSINTVQWQQKIEYYASRDPKTLKMNRTDMIRHVVDRTAGTYWSVDVDRSQAQDQGRSGNRESSLTLANTKYAAELTKRAGSNDWLISTFRDHVSLATHINEDSLCPWMTLAGSIQVYLLFKHDHVIIDKVEPIQQAGQDSIVKVTFTFRKSTSQTPDGYWQYVKSGVLELDPAHSYRPVKYQIRTAGPLEETTMVGSLEYEPGDGIPILKKMTDHSEGRSKRKGNVWGKTVSTFSNVEYNGKVNEEDFRLSTYGLPEPVGVEWPKKSRVWLWLIGGTILAALLAVFFRYLRQRTSATPNT